MKNLKEFYSKFLNEKGFTLVEVIVAVGLLGTLSVGIMEITNQQARLAVKSTVDGDFAQLNTQILSYLTNPAHCNANFYPLPANTADGLPHSMSTIKICTGSGIFNCRIIGTATTKFNVQNSSWLQSITGISDRIRIESAAYVVNPIQLGATGLGSLELTLTFGLKPMKTPSVVITKKFYTSVVVNGASIMGCPRAWNSTIVYGF